MEAPHGLERRGADAGVVGLAEASKSEMPCASAKAWMRAIDASPMPRRGRLAMRPSETPSKGLSITWRYATASLISARS